MAPAAGTPVNCLVFEAKPARKRPVRNMPQKASMADSSCSGEEVWEMSP